MNHKQDFEFAAGQTLTFVRSDGVARCIVRLGDERLGELNISDLMLDTHEKRQSFVSTIASWSGLVAEQREQVPWSFILLEPRTEVLE